MGLSICHWLEVYAQPLGLNLQELGGSTTRGSGLYQSEEHDSQTTTLIRGIAARIAQEMALSNSTIFDIAILAEVLAQPFNKAWSLMQPAALVTAHLLRQLSRRRPLRRNEGAWLSFQVAYLRALDQLLRQEAHLNRPWLDGAQVALTSALTLTPEQSSATDLRPLIDTLRPTQLTDTQAEQALVHGIQSLLLQQIHRVLVAWLGFHGAEEREAQLLVQRLEHGLAGHLLAAIAENATPLAQLQKFVRLGNLATWGTAQAGLLDYELLDDAGSLAINPQRELYRAQLLQSLNQPLLGQIFSLRDIYLPLRGIPYDGEVEAKSTPAGSPLGLAPEAASAKEERGVDSLSWAVDQLTQPQSILIVDAESGQGKTSFCHMLAVRLAQEVYPLWMPILISLRGLTLGATLEETLAPALPGGLFTEKESWLSSQNPPCVLILDGLDELPLGPDGEGAVARLFSQLVSFQKRYCDVNGMARHRILLTSHPLTLETLIQAHPEFHFQMQVQRLRLCALDQETLKQWFVQWAVLQSKPIAQAYFNFLKKGGAFRATGKPAFGTLVHQPFWLLVGALLHRDGLLDDLVFEQSRTAVRFEIYERLATWLMGPPTDTYPHPSIIPDLSRLGPAHACRSPDAIANLLAGRSPRLVRQQMRSAALTLLQSGRQQAPRCAIADLPEGYDLPHLYFRPTVLPTTMAGLTFTSPSLADHTCAEAIAMGLIRITQQIQTAYGETFVLESLQDVALHLYPLLGHSLLSPSLLSLVLERLRREHQRPATGLSLGRLCDRLTHFYRFYCRGRWLDDGIAQQAHQHLRALDNPLSLLQVDAVLGLNLFQILAACYRETPVRFCPCGDAQDPATFNPNQLSQLISHISTLSPLAFWEHARTQMRQLNLARASLNHALFAQANLSQTNLSEAFLAGTTFEGANLTQADLRASNATRANFQGANLQGANLQGANLQGANLQGAKLQGASLTNACLVDALLDPETADLARSSGAFFERDRFQAYQRLLWSETRQGDSPLSSEDTDGYAVVEDAEGTVAFSLAAAMNATLKTPVRTFPATSSPLGAPQNGYAAMAQGSRLTSPTTSAAPADEALDPEATLMASSSIASSAFHQALDPQILDHSTLDTDELERSNLETQVTPPTAPAHAALSGNNVMEATIQPDETMAI